MQGIKILIMNVALISSITWYGTISPIPGDKKAIEIRYVLNAISSDFSSLEHFCSRVLKK